MPDTSPGPIIVSLPVANRPTSSAFYRAFLDRLPPGEPRDDGEPEPLVFPLNDGVSLMLVPSDGFGWVIGEAHDVASRGSVEVVLTREAESEDAVGRAVEAAERGGGTVVMPPGRRPWGYVALVADPDGHLWQVITEPLG